MKRQSKRTTFKNRHFVHTVLRTFSTGCNIRTLKTRVVRSLQTVLHEKSSKRCCTGLTTKKRHHINNVGLATNETITPQPQQPPPLPLPPPPPPPQLFPQQSPSTTKTKAVTTRLPNFRSVCAQSTDARSMQLVGIEQGASVCVTHITEPRRPTSVRPPSLPPLRNTNAHSLQYKRSSHTHTQWVCTHCAPSTRLCCDRRKKEIASSSSSFSSASSFRAGRSTNCHFFKINKRYIICAYI